MSLKHKFKQIKIRSNLVLIILFLNFLFLIMDIYVMFSSKVTSGQKLLHYHMAVKDQEAFSNKLKVLNLFQLFIALSAT